jgi:dienelactone hydrolase
VRLKRTITSVCACLALTVSVAGCTEPDVSVPTPGPVTPGPDGGASTSKGPDPTVASISAPRGTFATATARVARGNGFGGGTIYYPTVAGTYGGIVLAPGFTAYQSSVAWYAPLLASNGFVVFTIDTNTTMDQPSSRARQELAALKYLTESSAAKDKVDPTRLGVGGWSMGGGGALEAARSNRNIKAVFPMAPWNLNTNWRSLTTPTLVTACLGDVVAPTGVHAQPFYRSLGGPKVYLEISGANHMCVCSYDRATARATLSWAKLYIDGDQRYKQFLTAGITGQGAVSFKSEAV